MRLCRRGLMISKMMCLSDMSTLYELTAARLTLKHTLEGLDMDAVTIEDTLEGDSTELQAKIEDYGFVIREMDSFADAIKVERDRLDNRLKAHEGRVSNIKEWLLKNMVACGITKIECPAFSIAVQNNPPSVVIDHEGSLPMEMFNYPEAPPPSPNKKAIAAAIKSGVDVPGCHLAQSQRLVIK